MVTAALLSLAIAQVAIEKQPDLDAMQAAVKEAWAKRPRDAKALVAIKQGPIEQTLAADLAAFDWLTPGSWSFPEQKFGARWEDDEPYQYDVARVLPDGQRLSFSFTVSRKDPAKRELTHTNFTLPSPISAGLKKVGKETYWRSPPMAQRSFTASCRTRRAR